MSANYHTPIAFRAAANSPVVNDPLATLDTELTAQDARLDTLESVRAGNADQTQLNLGAPTTLTIASGSITVTRTYHKVDTESMAASDDLEAIVGVAGDVLLLELANASRTVTVKHNAAAGNIILADGEDRLLDNTNHPLLLFYNGVKWVEHYQPVAPVESRELIDSTLLLTRDMVWPDDTLLALGNEAFELALLPDLRARRHVYFQARGATIDSLFTGTFTEEGTGSSDPLTRTQTARYTNSGALNSDAGIFNAVVPYRRQWNPVMDVLLVSPSVSSNIRIWVGLFNGDPMASDSPALDLAAFRYSTGGGDTGWRGAVKDGSTLQLTASLGAVAISTFYALRLRVDDSAGIVYFSVDGGAESSLNANLPAATTNLNWYIEFRVTSAQSAFFGLARGQIITA